MSSAVYNSPSPITNGTFCWTSLVLTAVRSPGFVHIRSVCRSKPVTISRNTRVWLVTTCHFSTRAVNVSGSYTGTLYVFQTDILDFQVCHIFGEKKIFGMSCGVYMGIHHNLNTGSLN